ncbi:MAG: hypothetical protein RR100_26975, partial [Comamonas sp.]
RPHRATVGMATRCSALACRLIEVSGFHLFLNFQYLLKFMQMLGFRQNNFHTGPGSRVKHCGVDFHQFTRAATGLTQASRGGHTHRTDKEKAPRRALVCADCWRRPPGNSEVARRK